MGLAVDPRTPLGQSSNPSVPSCAPAMQLTLGPPLHVWPNHMLPFPPPSVTHCASPAHRVLPLPSVFTPHAPGSPASLHAPHFTSHLPGNTVGPCRSQPHRQLRAQLTPPMLCPQSASDGFWKSVATRVPKEPPEIRILNPYFIQEAAFTLIGLPFNNGLMGRGVRCRGPWRRRRGPWVRGASGRKDGTEGRGSRVGTEDSVLRDGAQPWGAWLRTSASLSPPAELRASALPSSRTSQPLAVWQ